MKLRGCRLAWSRLGDLGSLDPGPNPGSPINGSKPVCVWDWQHQLKNNILILGMGPVSGLRVLAKLFKTVYFGALRPSELPLASLTWAIVLNPFWVWDRSPTKFKTRHGIYGA